MGKESDVIVYTEEELDAINDLQVAMTHLYGAVVKVSNIGIPLADAFESIGIQIPRVLQPAVNQLSTRLNSDNGTMLSPD